MRWALAPALASMPMRAAANRTRKQPAKRRISRGTTTLAIHRRRSIVLHSDFLHDRGPALCFLADEGGKFRWRAGGREQPRSIRLRLDGGIGQGLGHLRLQLIDDGCRRAP